MHDTAKWDHIVVTALDASQQNLFEKQLKCFEKRYETRISVVNDGLHKIGSGGATLVAINHLHKIYGQSLQYLKILCIHAGGLSQRLPHYTVLGKLFITFPTTENSSLFEMKLSNFTPLIPYLFGKHGGMLITCADDVLSYTLWNTPINFQYDILCLAHPSTIDIACSHGVFVLKNIGTKILDNDTLIEKEEIKEILQKPSAKDLLNKNALFTLRDNKLIALTDSSFVLSGPLLQKLGIIIPINELNEEIDCYIDFLHPSINGIKSTELQTKISYIHKFFCHFDLKLLVFPYSTYFHLGTFQEYIHSFCDYSNLPQTVTLARAFNFKKITSSFVNHEGIDLLKTEHSICILNSYINVNDQLYVDGMQNIVIEYCYLNLCPYSGKLIHIKLESNIILSHLRLDIVELEDTVVNMTLLIPKNTIWFTYPIHTGFVTFCFGISDDIKAIASRSLNNTLYLKYLNGHQLRLEDEKSGNCSLWYVRLFPHCITSTQSFIHTQYIVTDILRDTYSSAHEIRKKYKKLYGEKTTFISMHDICSNRTSIGDMILAYRDDLKKKIRNN